MQRADVRTVSCKVVAKGKHITPQLLEQPASVELLRGVDTLVLDCDGVLWEGNDIIQGSVESLLKLRKMGKQLLFVTNNSSKSRAMYVEKFNQLGIQADKEEIVGASFAAAAWLKNQGFNQKVFVIGDVGVRRELEEVGIRIAEDVDVDSDPECNVESFKRMRVEPGVGAVVVGCDQAFTYRKLAYASCCIQQGALFVGTNGDSADVIGGRLMPGCGALVDALSASTGRSPDIIAGKPSSWLLELLQLQYGVEPERTAVVGDRLDTDIQMGWNAGAALNIMTLSGVSTWADVEDAASEGRAVPHFVIPKLSYLLD